MEALPIEAPQTPYLVTGLFETRIRDFKVTPKEVVVGGEVTAEGYLEYNIPLVGWRPLEGKEVSLVINDVEISTTYTTKGGYFKFAWTPTTPGTYRVKTRFKGTAVYEPVESFEVIVKVISEEEKKRREEEFMRTAILATVAIGIAAGLGLGLYFATRK